jgi:hypothetical protein
MSTITISEIGTIGSEPPFFDFDGIDGIGIFGPPGASLIGKSFMAIFTGSDCNCSGGTLPDGTPLGNGGINPVQDATLMINGVTFDFGSLGSACCGDMFTSLAQTEVFQPTFSVFNIQGGGLGMGAGEFEFTVLGVGRTSGTFIGQLFSNSAFVPGPVAGDFLPYFCSPCCRG